MNYEKDMYIDENALDYEILEQPALMVKYSTLLAEAKQERDLAKEAMDLEKAQIDLGIREDPPAFGLGEMKITEALVTNTILTVKEYQDAQSKYNKANYEVNVLQGVVYAIDARKSALENLVKLHGQQYFSGPSIPHNLSELREQKRDAASHRIGSKLKRKPKEN